MADLHVGKIEILAQAATGRSEDEIKVKTDVDYYGTLDEGEIIACVIDALFKVGRAHELTHASIVGRVEEFDSKDRG